MTHSHVAAFEDGEGDWEREALVGPAISPHPQA